MQTAARWGRLPSELGLCQPQDDLSYMVALTMAENKMQSWERKIAEAQQRG